MHTLRARRRRTLPWYPARSAAATSTSTSTSRTWRRDQPRVNQIYRRFANSLNPGTTIYSSVPVSAGLGSPAVPLQPSTKTATRPGRDSARFSAHQEASAHYENIGFALTLVAISLNPGINRSPFCAFKPNTDFFFPYTMTWGSAPTCTASFSGELASQFLVDPNGDVPVKIENASRISSCISLYGWARFIRRTNTLRAG